jgi:hypothetical protein
MIRRGDLAAVRLGRLVRVLAAAVDRLGEPGMASPTTPTRNAGRAAPRFVARA